MSLKLLIGFIAAGLTTFAFLPQMIKSIKNRHTKDISLIMYIVFVLGIVCWLIYGIMINAAPIIAANIVSLIFASIILMLKIKYK